MVPPLEVLVAQARSAHPELAVAHAQIAEADAGVEVAAAERKPDWVVQGGYMLMPGEVGAWTARVGITWPGAPWARKRSAIASAQATALAQAARADLAVSEQDVARTIAEARASLVGVLARLAIVRDTMRPQAVHVLDASRLSFAAGQLPLSDVLDAERMRVDTDIQIARLIGDADLAWAALEAAVGATPPSPDGKE
jgi:outer membrane protein TolC